MTELLSIENENKLNFHLLNFDGPLDLLLHLIRGSKLDIESVFLSDVTEQFLEYMKEIDTLDLETASEFLQVASTLLEIKSKALLPSYEEEDSPEMDEAELLLLRLEEYKLIKEAGTKLKEIEDVGKFFREPGKMLKEVKVSFKEEDVNRLLEAFSKMLLLSEEYTSRENMVTKIIPRDYITVEEQTDRIIQKLRTRGKMSLFSIFEDKPTKIQLVITLLALLEMTKNGLIKVEQDRSFSDVSIALIEIEEGAK